jgi:hypothetical protein
MFRWLRCAGATLVVLLPRAAAAEPPPAPEKVRLAYEAPSNCPTKEVFLAQVRGRVGTDWEAPQDVLAHTIDVRVESLQGHSVAKIDFEEQGQRVSRVVSASTCDEVVSGIALVTALAIESRVAEALDKSEPATTDAAPAESAAPAPPADGTAPPETMPATTPPVVVAPARVLVSPPPAHQSPPRARAYHVDFGAAGVAKSGVGPTLAWGGRVFGGVGWHRGPDFRIGVDYAQTPNRERGGAVTEFFLLGLRAAACPVAFGREGSVRVLPCAGVEAGAHHGESTTSPTIRGGSATLGSVAPFAAVRGEAVWGKVFVELELDARFPLRHPTFYFTDPRQDVYTVNPVAFGISTGIGLRL